MPSLRYDIVRKVRGENVVKKKTSMILVFVLVLIADVAFVYASVRFGLLDALRMGAVKAPSETVMESLIPLDISETQGDVRITLTDVAYDGNDFYIGYNYENLAPETLAMVICESIEANSKRVDIGEWVSGRFCTVPDVFGGLITPPEYQTWTPLSLNPVVNYVEGELIENPGPGEWQVKVTFLIKRFPAKTIVVDTDTYIKETYGWAWDEEADALSREAPGMYEGEFFFLDAVAAHDARLEQVRSFGISVADEDERDPEMWKKRGYLVINSNGGYYGECDQETFPTGYFEEFETVEGREMYNLYVEDAPNSPLEEVGRITLEFTLNSDQTK